MIKIIKLQKTGEVDVLPKEYVFLEMLALGKATYEYAEVIGEDFNECETY
jgi:hypothetical protein